MKYFHLFFLLAILLLPLRTAHADNIQRSDSPLYLYSKTDTRDFLLNLSQTSFSHGLFHKTVNGIISLSPHGLSFKDAIRFHLLLGLSYVEMGSSQGEKEFNILKKLSPPEHILNLFKGALAWREKKYKKAFLILDSIEEEINTQFHFKKFKPYLNYKKGQCGNKEKAKKYFLNAIKLSPSFAPANLELGKLAQKDGDYKGAIVFFRKYLQMKPEDFNVLLSLGEAYLKQGEYGKAIVSLKKAKKIRPMETFPTLKLIEWYKKILDIEPKNSLILFKVGALYDKVGNYDEAIRYYKLLIESDPKSYVGYNQIAWNLGVKKKQPKQALRYALKAVELNGENGSLLDTLGWIYYLLGNYEKAHETLLKAEALHLINPTFSFHLAMVKVKLGKFRDAYDILIKLRDKLFPEREEARKLIEYIEKSINQ